mgnify:CR=1 FL=1|jgi:hypothetical protein
MVDNITLKCYDKEVYHHLRYGTFVEKSNWINGRWYDKLVLNKIMGNPGMMRMI